eukprot:110717-Amphidinium_carterae.1
MAPPQPLCHSLSSPHSPQSAGPKVPRPVLDGSFKRLVGQSESLEHTEDANIATPSQILVSSGSLKWHLPHEAVLSGGGCPGERYGGTDPSAADAAAGPSSPVPQTAAGGFRTASHY